MEALAKEAGVSNPLVYKYFDTRHELMQELLVREFNRFLRDLKGRLAEARNFEEVVKIVVTVNFDEADRGSVRQILRSQPDIREIVREEEKKASRKIGRFLVDEIADNYSLTRAQAEQIVIMGSGASVSAAERVNRSGRNRERLIADTVKFIFGGIESFKDDALRAVAAEKKVAAK